MRQGEQDVRIGRDRHEPRRMSPAEFRHLGLLQEVNRQFLHPRGLALEVIEAGRTGFFFRVTREGVTQNLELSQMTVQEIEDLIVHAHPAARTASLIRALAHLADMAPERFGEVWDYRSDREGIVFGERPDAAKAAYADGLLEKCRAAREELLGGTVIQPLDWPPVPADAAGAEADCSVGMGKASLEPPAAEAGS